MSNGLGFVLLESSVTYRPFLTEEEEMDVGVNFSDAKQMGVLNSKIAIFKSNCIPENQILVALAGNGTEIVTLEDPSLLGVPHIEVKTSKKPHKQVGQVEHWGLIEILDVF